MNPMKTNSSNFIKGFLAGLSGALLLLCGVMYVLNVTGYAVFQFPLETGLNALINFVYDNLKLSIIPFTVILIAYVYYLKKLGQQLEDTRFSLEQVAQTEHLIDTCISLFFGIGVIWTAIGMRSSLMYALGNPESAAADGAFAILQRMVDGGILLALSTTIVGGIGGYLMRMIKSLSLGLRLQHYYNHHLFQQSESAYQILERIEQHLAVLVKPNKEAT